ncbi:MAG: fluoride efflux transporter CrcB [Firmicutes bacterium]|nr:fluoride efflux transporter CrcB [Bacillota bacterium]
MVEWIMVALGGSLGAVSRYALSDLVRRISDPSMPYGTLAVNVLGSFLLGFFLARELSSARAGLEWRLFVTAGFLGAFTTFSAFSYETFAMLAEHDLHRAGLNIVLNVFLGLAGMWAGYALGKSL